MPDLALYIVAALVAGGGVGLAVALVLAKRMSPEPEVAFEPVEEHPVTFVPPAPRAMASAPPRASAASRPEREPVMILTNGVRMRDMNFQRGGLGGSPPNVASRPREVVLPRAPPPPAPVPSEWARRQVGPVDPGRSKGVCSGCGTSISVSNARPLRIACPVCGRSKLLA